MVQKLRQSRNHQKTHRRTSLHFFQSKAVQATSSVATLLGGSAASGSCQLADLTGAFRAVGSAEGRQLFDLMVKNFDADFTLSRLVLGAGAGPSEADVVASVLTGDSSATSWVAFSALNFVLRSRSVSSITDDGSSERIETIATASSSATDEIKEIEDSFGGDIGTISLTEATAR